MILVSLSFASEAVFLPASADTDDKTISIPNDLKPDQVGDFVAPLSEQQVRQLLIDKIQTQAEINAESRLSQSLSVFELLKGVGDPNSVLLQGVRSTIEMSKSFWFEIGKRFEEITPGRSFVGFLTLVGVLLFSVVLAKIFEWVCLRGLRRWIQSNKAATGQAGTEVDSGSAIWAFSLDLLGLFLFMLAGYISAHLLTDDGSTLAILVSRLFGAILVIRFFLFCFSNYCCFLPRKDLN